jgi:pimeloyl-ACP methyl ester carboxylesterase
LKERVLDAAMRTPQHVVASAFRNIAAFDAEAALRVTSVPILLVDAASVLRGEDRLRAAKPDVMLGKTVGSGHFHQLEVPEQINAMLDRFFAIVGDVSR